MIGDLTTDLDVCHNIVDRILGAYPHLRKLSYSKWSKTLVNIVAD
jgi:hypothetical protein